MLFMFCVFMLLRLFIAALGSPAGKGLTSYVSFVLFDCVCHLIFGYLGQVWYLIVSITDLCHISYFTYRDKQICRQNNHCGST